MSAKRKMYLAELKVAMAYGQDARAEMLMNLIRRNR
jgi:hypothetical protein